MKIGIITLPFNTNFGGILQNFALQKVLKDMKHEVVTIEKLKQYQLPFSRRYLAYIKRIIKKFIFQNNCEIFFERNEKERFEIITKEIRPFINRYIQLKKYKEFKDIRKNEYDAFIVGSDQIWRPIYFPDITKAYLSFAKKWNIKRIAYAVSFGTDKWEYNEEQSEKCKKLISLFDGVSVREFQGIELCKKYFNIDAVQVLDPTLLLSKEDYIKVFTEEKAPQSKGNFLVYILDSTEEKETIIQEISNSKGLIPFYTNNPEVENTKINVYKRIQPNIAQWLRGFHDADFVFTDSFHACVFSIIFQKPFLVYGNVERGLSRFFSLLCLFHLEDRIILNRNDFKKVQNKEINWKEVNIILEENKQKSFSFIKQHLIVQNKKAANK